MNTLARVDCSDSWLTAWQVHLSCLRKWLHYKPHCPLCRTQRLSVMRGLDAATASQDALAEAGRSGLLLCAAEEEAEAEAEAARVAAAAQHVETGPCGRAAARPCFGAACFGASELPALRLRSQKELRLPSNLAVFHMQEEAKESAAKEEEMRTQQAVAALDAALHVGAPPSVEVLRAAS